MPDEKAKFGVPALVIIALLGGGGASYGGLQLFSEGTASGDGAEALKMSNSTNVKVAALETQVDAVIEMQKKTGEQIEQIRRDQREDFRDLGNLVREETRRILESTR
jgi:hypothetical protein